MSTTLDTLFERLSAERLQPYVAAVGGDRTAALRLYEWNTAISGAFYETLQIFEVILRNACHRELTIWHGDHPGEWFSDPRKILDERARQDIQKVAERLAKEHKEATTGRVIAELSFGFWRFLLTKRYTDSLWIPHLRYAFPGLPEGHDRQNVDRTIRPIHELRNRIAHHEPIHGYPLAGYLQRIQEVTSWICPVSSAWMTVLTRVSAVLDRRPSPGGVRDK